MKKIRTPKSYGLALAALLLGSASWAFATPNFYVNNFDVGGAASVAPGGVSTGSGTSPCGIWYGPSMIAWDNTQNSTLNNDPDPTIIPGAGGGSCYVYAPMDPNNNNTLVDFFCAYPYDNLWYAGNPAGVDLSQYVAVHFDILWDTVNSTITIDQFNNLSSLPSPPLQNWAGLLLMASPPTVPEAIPMQTGLTYKLPATAARFLPTLTYPTQPRVAG